MATSFGGAPASSPTRVYRTIGPASPGVAEPSASERAQPGPPPSRSMPGSEATWTRIGADVPSTTRSQGIATSTGCSGSLESAGRRRKRNLSRTRSATGFGNSSRNRRRPAGAVPRSSGRATSPSSTSQRSWRAAGDSMSRWSSVPKWTAHSVSCRTSTSPRPTRTSRVVARETARGWTATRSGRAAGSPSWRSQSAGGPAEVRSAGQGQSAGGLCSAGRKTSAPPTPSPGPARSTVRSRSVRTAIRPPSDIVPRGRNSATPTGRAGSIACRPIRWRGISPTSWARAVSRTVSSRTPSAASPSGASADIATTSRGPTDSNSNPRGRPMTRSKGRPCAAW